MGTFREAFPFFAIEPRFKKASDLIARLCQTKRNIIPIPSPVKTRTKQIHEVSIVNEFVGVFANK
jgi:hypothetical protein